MYVKLFSGIFGRHIEGEPFFANSDGKVAYSEPTVGINCGGRGTKRISLEHFLAIGDRLAREGVRVEFILGPDETALRAGLEARLREGCTLLAPMTLKNLMTVFKRYRVFISSDTGPMHLAWTMGIPTVAIFVDSELEKFRPLAPGSMAVDGMSGIDLDLICDRVLGLLKTARISP
jgi:ADP-heptose:LPS heptosyltransferase